MIDAHRGAFEYDWRARFHQPLTVVGTAAMTWGEALRLTRLLAADPASQVAAAMSGWTHPADRVALVLMDLYDLQHTSKATRKPQPYPRPFSTDKSEKKRIGNASLPLDELRRVLAAHRAVVDAQEVTPEKRDESEITERR